MTWKWPLVSRGWMRGPRWSDPILIPVINQIEISEACNNTIKRKTFEIVRFKFTQIFIYCQRFDYTFKIKNTFYIAQCLAWSERLCASLSTGSQEGRDALIKERRPACYSSRLSWQQLKRLCILYIGHVGKNKPVFTDYLVVFCAIS